MVYRLRQTDVFAKWLAGLRDRKAKGRILARLEACRLGNLGDTKAIGGGVREMRVHVGAGYRVYFVQQRELVCCFCVEAANLRSLGIKRAQRLRAQLEDE